MKPAELERVGTLPQLVHAAADRYGDARALGLADRPDDALSYRDLRATMQRGALALIAQGLQPDDRIALLLPPGPAWVTALLAILDAGLVAVPLAPETPADERAAQMRHTGARGLVQGAGGEPPPGGIACLDAGDLLHPIGAAESEHVARQRRPEDPALLAFTSGCTGRPRAVELSHRNLLSDLRSLLAADRAAPDDVFLSLLPPWHMFELVVGLLAPLACGAAVFYSGPPLPNRIVDQIRRLEVTHTLAVPALLQALYREILDSLAGAGRIDEHRREQSLQDTALRLRDELGESEVSRLREAVRERIGPELRFVGCGGAAIPRAWEDILPRLGITLACGYGLTEAGPVVCMNHCGSAPRGSIGRPLPGIEVRIAQDGEILVRGDNVMQGYYGDAEATAAALRDGWLHTGDLGHLDGDGNLFFVGRAKDAIVTAGGTCLDPEQFERHYRSPHFAEICVTALRDLEGNDIPTLVAVPADPGTSDEALEQEFACLRGRAPAHLRITRLALVRNMLPRTATGKLRRTTLAKILGDHPEQVKEA